MKSFSPSFRTRILCILSVVALLSASGCKPGTNDNSVPRFAFIINVSGLFWDIAHAGCLQAAKEEGVDIDLFVPGQSTAAEQIQIIETLVSKGYAGMAISPLNPDSMTRILDRATKHMLVICMDSDAADSQRLCYIGTDNVHLGRRMGDELKKLVPEGGEVAVLAGQMDVSNSQGRYQGVVESLSAEGDKYKILGPFSDGGDRPTCKSNATDVLSKHPNLKAFVGLWGYHAFMAAAALDDNREHDITIVGCDEDIQTIYAIRDGKQDVSIAQRPYEFGYQSIKTLARIHRGEKVELPENKVIFVPTYKIDQANLVEKQKDVKDWLAKRDALLSKDWLKEKADS